MGIRRKNQKTEDGMTKMRKDILEMYSKGWKCWQIATALDIPESTVRYVVNGDPK